MTNSTPKARCDFETQSRIDIKTAGAEVYAEDALTKPICLSWAIDDEPVQVWKPGDAPPQRLLDHVAAGGLVGAWNVAFERVIWNRQMTKRFDWPAMSIEQTDDTMAKAAAMSMPLALGNCAIAAQLPIQKDEASKGVMLRISRPRQIKRPGDKEYDEWLALAATAAGPLPEYELSPDGEVIRWWTPETAFDKFETTYAYCVQDTEVERALDKILFDLRPLERRIWLLDQKINARGLLIDRTAAEGAALIAAASKKLLDQRMTSLTGGAVKACSQAAALVQWLGGQGVETESVDKDAVRKLLAKPDLPITARQALELRRVAAKSSIAKLKPMRFGACSDGRIRGVFMYHGAGTGRWAGRRLQPQNMPRTSKGMKKDMIEIAFEMFHEAAANPRRAAKLAALMEITLGDPPTVISDCLRGMIIPGPGRRFIRADYSNVEGRGLPWLCAQEDKLAAFRAYDAKTGPDLYLVAAAGIYGVPVDSLNDESPERQVGKAAELGLGYGGGIGAAVTMGKTYGVDFGPVFPGLWERADDEMREKAEHAADSYLKRAGGEITREAAIAADLTKQAWRTKWLRIVRYWTDLEEAAVAAVENPGQVFRAGAPGRQVAFRKVGSFLWLRLPSGRPLCYPYPEMQDKKTPWGAMKAVVTYMGTDTRQGSPTYGKWTRLHTYGGKLAENCVAGHSQIATMRGWVPLVDLRPDDRLWDGEEFVRHGGIIAKGEQATVSVDGVRMTGDHLVLTERGWRDASSCGGSVRAAVAPPDRGEVRGFGRQEVPVAGEVRLRPGGDDAGERIYQGQTEVVRLPAPGSGLAGETAARHDRAPGLLGVAVNARPLPAPDAPGLEELRRPGHPSVPGMGVVVRRVLARHGTDVQERAEHRAHERERQLRARELLLGDEQGAGAEQASEPACANPVGGDDGGRGVGAVGDRGYDPTLPAGRWGSSEPFVLSAGRHEQVFDIVNAGPRNRFVVRGETAPFIVHNCTQAICRDLLAEALLRLEDAGYPVELHVHDEANCPMPFGQGSAEEFGRLMAELPEWAAGLPLVAVGEEANRYRK